MEEGGVISEKSKGLGWAGPLNKKNSHWRVLETACGQGIDPGRSRALLDQHESKEHGGDNTQEDAGGIQDHPRAVYFGRFLA